MKKITNLFLAALSAVVCLLSGPKVSVAQVWGIGPDGRMGYVQTRNPISPTCAPPQVWTLTNGHYACGNPVPPPPTCGLGYTQTTAPTWNGSSWVGMWCVPNTPPPIDPQAVCMANKPANWIVTGTYPPGRVISYPAGETGLEYLGTGDTTLVDKCGNPVNMNHLTCMLSTADTSFIKWTEMSDFGTGSCGH